jgi:diguanylate cyclase (GGDEF)-like protein
VIADRIRLTIPEKPIRMADDAPFLLNITISIGVAVPEAADASLFNVLGRANRALYRAKASGRNRVECETAE